MEVHAVHTVHINDFRLLQWAIFIRQVSACLMMLHVLSCIQTLANHCLFFVICFCLHKHSI